MHLCLTQVMNQSRGAHISAGNFGKQNLTEKLYDYCQIFVG